MAGSGYCADIWLLVPTWLYGVTHNYGVAIIIITIIIKLLFYPLSGRASVDASHAATQPQMKRSRICIRTTSELNEEMMRLYASRRSTPGCCLPMVVQIPVSSPLPGSYASIELRHAGSSGGSRICPHPIIPWLSSWAPPWSFSMDEPTTGDHGKPNDAVHADHSLIS